MTLPFSWEKDDKTQRSSKVGQAVADFLSKPQETIEVGEIIEEYADSYAEMVRKAITENRGRYESPFYVLVLTKKEPWALNVMRNWFIARQTKPSALSLRLEYPNHMQTVYQFDSTNEQLKILWSLPTAQDAAVILKNAPLYHSDLVNWIRNFNEGKFN